ncbi:MAG TPA: hypothetical protein VII23_10330 [Terriglobales bacterium]
MPSISYTRHDYTVRIESGGEAAQILSTPPEGLTIRTPIALEILDRGVSGADADLRKVLAGVLSTPTKVALPSTMDRIVLEVGERRWAAIPFESFLPPNNWLVRSSPVRPRALQRPLAFPLRVLEIGLPLVVANAIEQTFRGAYRDDAFVNGHTTLGDADALARREKWASVDILHVHGFQPGPATLSTARALEPGTLGWMLRFADVFQTRLIVLEGDPASMAQLRIVAQTILDRGGPALWLFEGPGNEYAAIYGGIAHDRPLDWIRPEAGGELFAGRGAEESLRYSPIGEAFAQPNLVQDMIRKMSSRIQVSQALVRRTAQRRTVRVRTPQSGDVVKAIMESAQQLRIPVSGSVIPYTELYGTRAERMGTILSSRLVNRGFLVHGLDAHLKEETLRGVNVDVHALTQHVQTNARPLSGITKKTASKLFGTTLLRVGDQMPYYRFEDHESDGMLPLAGKVVEARTVANRLTVKPSAFKSKTSSPVAHTPRHVNIHFCAATMDNRLERLPQSTTRLKTGETVHLEVEIAAKTAGSKSLGSTAFFEEQVRWSEEGAWIEIGVTGIDFDVLGDPVQEVWLPRDTPMDRVTFAVRPRARTTVPGVARLRVAIYQQNNLIQCFMVAALLKSNTEKKDPAASLAKALNASAEKVRRKGGVGYLPRLEYATTPSVNPIAARRRGLTIIANDSAGEKVVTFKGDDLFTVKIDPLLPEKVKRLREALDRASARNGMYRYTFQNKVNNGNPNELLDVLWDIAESGFDIFNRLIPDEEDQKRVRATLAGSDGIHAAHIDASSVIPWSMVYDRPVIKTCSHSDDETDPTARVYQVASAVCPASMPRADGAMPAMECGGQGCLLNASDNEVRKKAGDPIYLEETVICARRFWGFMVPIEVPAQQVDGLATRSTTAMAESIRAHKPVTVAAGFNPNLEFSRTHATDLQENVFITKQTKPAMPRASLLTPAKPGRDPLRQFLLQVDPEIVYFFCHALASLQSKGKTYGPALDFGRGFEGVAEDVIEAREFAGKRWTRAPLVFINGCSSAGFSPYAPSEFITEFIKGRKAAAVIGTEVTVWEALATEMAKRFLLTFLDGKTSAGEALLKSRRSLLAMNNPLGLAYTLYGSSNLTLNIA